MGRLPTNTSRIGQTNPNAPGLVEVDIAAHNANQNNARRAQNAHATQPGIRRQATITNRTAGLPGTVGGATFRANPVPGRMPGPLIPAATTEQHADDVNDQRRNIPVHRTFKAQHKSGNLAPVNSEGRIVPGIIADEKPLIDAAKVPLGEKMQMFMFMTGNAFVKLDSAVAMQLCNDDELIPLLHKLHYEHNGTIEFADEEATGYYDVGDTAVICVGDYHLDPDQREGTEGQLHDTLRKMFGLAPLHTGTTQVDVADDSSSLAGQVDSDSVGSELGDIQTRSRAKRVDLNELDFSNISTETREGAASDMTSNQSDIDPPVLTNDGPDVTNDDVDDVETADTAMPAEVVAQPEIAAAPTLTPDEIDQLENPKDRFTASRRSWRDRAAQNPGAPKP